MAHDMAGATQDELRRHNLGSLLRLLHVHGADVPVGPDRPDRAEPQHGRGADDRPRRGRPGAASGHPVGRGGAGRPSIVVGRRPSGCTSLARRRRRRPPDRGAGRARRRGAGPARACASPAASTRRQDPAPVERLTRSVLAGADGRTRSASASAPASAASCGTPTAWSGSPRTSAGSTSRSASRSPSGWRPALPVTVGNDADLGALAEHLRGAAVGADDVVYLSGEVGIGGGSPGRAAAARAPAGTPARSATWWSTRRGRLCRCGARGCWETEVGENAVLCAAGMPDGSDPGRAGSRPGRRPPGRAPGCARVGPLARRRHRQPGQRLQPRGGRVRRRAAPAAAGHRGAGAHRAVAGARRAARAGAAGRCPSWAATPP